MTQVINFNRKNNIQAKQNLFNGTCALKLEEKPDNDTEIFILDSPQQNEPRKILYKEDLLPRETHIIDEYGNHFPQWSLIDNPRLQAKPYDRYNKMYYYFKRDLSATMRHFTAPDPAEPDIYNPITFNEYLAMNNNPIKYRDPYGLWIIDRKVGSAQVERGDYLWDLAKKLLGKYANTKEINRLKNHLISYNNIINPNLIYSGDYITFESNKYIPFFLIGVGAIDEQTRIKIYYTYFDKIESRLNSKGYKVIKKLSVTQNDVSKYMPTSLSRGLIIAGHGGLIKKDHNNYFSRKVIYGLNLADNCIPLKHVSTYFPHPLELVSLLGCMTLKSDVLAVSTKAKIFQGFKNISYLQFLKWSLGEHWFMNDIFDAIKLIPNADATIK